MPAPNQSSPAPGMVKGINNAPALPAMPMTVARAPPKRQRDRSGGQRPHHAPDTPHGEEEADHTRRGVHRAHQEDDLDRRRDATEQVGGGGRGRDGAQQRVAEDEAQPLVDVVEELRVPILRHRRLRLGAADGAHGGGRGEKAHRVHGHGRRAADRLNETAGNARARHRGDLRAAGQLRVAFDQVLPPDERGKVGLIGDVEEHGEDAAGQCDDEQLDQGEPTDGVGDRDRAERKHPTEVGADHDPASTYTIDPDARREPDEQEGRRRCRREQPHLERGGVQRAHRQQRNGEEADLRSELAHGLAAPEQSEVAVPQQHPLRHRRTLTRRRHATRWGQAHSCTPGCGVV